MGTPKLSAEGAKFEAPKAPSIERRRREIEEPKANMSFRKLTTMGTPKLRAEGAKFEGPKAPSIERRRREIEEPKALSGVGSEEGCSLPTD